MRAVFSPSSTILRRKGLRSMIIVVADHARAHVWRVDAQASVHVAEVQAPDTRLSDKQGAHVDVNSGYVHASFGHGKEEAHKRFASDIAAKIETALAAEAVPHLYLVASADIVHLITDHLSPAAREHLVGSTPKDLMGESIQTIIKRVR